MSKIVTVIFHHFSNSLKTVCIYSQLFTFCSVICQERIPFNIWWFFFPSHVITGSSVLRLGDKFGFQSLRRTKELSIKNQFFHTVNKTKFKNRVANHPMKCWIVFWWWRKCPNLTDGKQFYVFWKSMILYKDYWQILLLFFKDKFVFFWSDGPILFAILWCFIPKNILNCWSWSGTLT